MSLRITAATALLLAVALPTAAQQPVTLQFNAGRVTLQARNAPVRTILSEWARLGGATVVNGERVAGAPVTLDLTDVTERQALDIILRGVAGYMLAPRPAGSVGVSAFNRIMILPTSAAPQNPPPPAVAAAGRRPVVPRPSLIQRQPEAALDAPAEPEVEEPPAEPEPAADPSVIANPRIMPPGIRPLPGSEPNQDNDGGDEEPAAPSVAPTTSSNPFGVPVGSSTTPGVISPVPRPQQQGPANRVQ
jgi:hypothetical protein